MGELLDLILDFERKLVTLIRDLIVRPQNVVDSIVAKDKSYLSGFKFYTTAASVWIICFQLGNRFFDFFPEEYVLPQRLANFLKSEQDFAFLIAPFAGLIEFFIPFATLNWLLFRKQRLTWLNHISVNFYVAGLLLLYGLPIFISLYAVGNFTNADSNLVNWLAYIFLIFMPVAYYGWVHLKIMTSKKWLSFLKPIFTLIGISFVSVSLFLDQPFHELLHRKILFSKFNQFTLEASFPENKLSYKFNDTLYFEYPDKNNFIAEQINKKSYDAHSFVVSQYDRMDRTYRYRLISKSSVKNNSVWLSGKAFDVPHFFSVGELEASPYLFLLRRKLFHVNNSDTLWLTVFKDNHIENQKHYEDYISVLSRIISSRERIIFSGFSRVDREPILGELSISGDSLKSIASIGNMKNHSIDDLQKIGFENDGNIQMIFSLTENNRLRKIEWMKGEYESGKFLKKSEINIYKNEFTPTQNFYYQRDLHKGTLVRVNDSTSIVGFQVMTDSSFAINLTSIHTKKNQINWNSIISLPADFIQNDHILVDGSSVFLLGRAMSVFNSGFSSLLHQLPYIQTVELSTGDKKKFFLLPMDKNDKTEYERQTLESIYRVSSTAFQDVDFIHWNIGGNHDYKISKKL